MRLISFVFLASLLFSLAACAISSKPVAQVGESDEGLVLEQSILDADQLIQLVIRNDSSLGARFRFHFGPGLDLDFTKGEGCLWRFLATVNNAGGTICVRSPSVLSREIISRRSGQAPPSVVVVDTYGIPLPRMERKYLVGLASDFPESRILPEREMSIPEIRGLIREIQSGRKKGVIYFPSSKETPSYLIRLNYRGGCAWDWEHRGANDEIFAEGQLYDCELAGSGMIDLMLIWH